MKQMEKWDKVVKIGIIVCLIASVFIALLPCFAFKQEVFEGVLQQYGSSDFAAWSEGDLTSMLLDSALSDMADGLNTGLISNMARSTVVILFGGIVLTYSSNMYVFMLYFIILLIGVPVLTLTTAGFQVWGKTDKKRILSVIFIGVNILLCASIFLVVPGLCVSFVKDLAADINSIYLQMIRTLVFQVMIRSMAIGFWGFLAFQALALVGSIYRMANGIDQPVAVSRHTEKKKKGVIMGISGAYAGAELLLEAGGIIVGRDAANAELIIEAPKVSRRHCRIVYDAQKGEYLVTDYSTNGTFAGKQRLTKGVAEKLPAGTVLNIGDSRNSFRLM